MHLKINRESPVKAQVGYWSERVMSGSDEIHTYHYYLLATNLYTVELFNQSVNYNTNIYVKT